MHQATLLERISLRVGVCRLGIRDGPEVVKKKENNNNKPRPKTNISYRCVYESLTEPVDDSSGRHFKNSSEVQKERGDDASKISVAFQSVSFSLKLA